jgi:hypothetical protein
MSFGGPTIDHEPEEGAPGHAQVRLDLHGSRSVVLRRNQKAVSEVPDRLTGGGAATVGDCVAAIEGW